MTNYHYLPYTPANHTQLHLDMLRSKSINLALQTLNPVILNIVDFSHKHGNSQNTESHFEITIITDVFIGVPLVKRHRMVQELVKQEFTSGLHALCLHTYTAKEWEQGAAKPITPPDCRHN